MASARSELFDQIDPFGVGGRGVVPLGRILLIFICERAVWVGPS